ncbi:hypothetical protein LOTGIDRAFT_153797 [Lottia gigantea]|uniref:Apple domain-containing protein n=1 Tax=Lottia gigantea TaxID=225164 RepID=V4ADH8_LOTGI|nr:hypothetical protein LOTGIDRAFT_153797 [Lottia gigantea]ESO91361.1 hypothetical protein LOTGIDRAFT_153797 [Lottia gigantea]
MEASVFLCFGFWQVVVGQLPSPVSLWPLAKSSFSYDVIKGEDGVFPKLTDCFKADETGNPALRYGALYLDDVENSYIDIAIPGPNMESFAISLQLYAERDSFSVMHFLSDNNENGVSTMEIRITERELTLFLEHVGFISITDFLDLKTWITLTFSYNYVSGEFKAYKNEDLVESTIGNARVKLILPAILRLGNPQVDHIRNQFKGMMTCLAFYNVSEGFDTYFPDMKTYCDAAWTNPPPMAPVCFDETPVCLFPLDDVNYVCDVIKHVQPVNKDTCFRFSQKHPDLPNNAIYFDGSITSTVQSSIAIKYFQNDFTIASFLFLSENSFGTILEVIFESKPISWTGISRVEVSVNGTRQLLVQLFNSGKCGLLVTTQLSYNTWYSFSLQRIADSRKLSMVLDGTEVDIIDSCDTSAINDSYTASLFLGGGNNLMNYQGQMRCLLVFDSWLHPSIINARLKTICGQQQAVTGNLCDQQPTLKSQMFIKLKPDSVPKMDIEPFHVISTTDISRCSSHCVVTEFCRAFTLSGSRCSLYDFVTTQHFNSVVGTDYFVSQF